MLFCSMYFLGMKLDMEYIAQRVTDVQQFLELCPNPSSGDIGKMLAVQAGVLQAEGLGLLRDAGDLPGAAKIRRIALAVEVLKASTESFMGADKILARNEGRELAFRRELELRRIANDELLATLAGSGLMIDSSSVDSGLVAGSLKLVGVVDPDGGELVVTQKRRRRSAGVWEKYVPVGAGVPGEQ